MPWTAVVRAGLAQAVRALAVWAPEAQVVWVRVVWAQVVSVRVVLAQEAVALRSAVPQWCHCRHRRRMRQRPRRPSAHSVWTAGP